MRWWVPNLRPYLWRHCRRWSRRGIFLLWVRRNTWQGEGCRAVLIGGINTGDGDIFIPFKTHFNTTMRYFTRNSSWRVEVCKGISFLFGKGIDCFNTHEFGSWKLCEPLFGFDLLLLYHFELLIACCFLDRERLARFWFRRWLHFWINMILWIILRYQ